MPMSSKDMVMAAPAAIHLDQELRRGVASLSDHPLIRGEIKAAIYDVGRDAVRTVAI
jgi:hypothetical protein